MKLLVLILGAKSGEYPRIIKNSLKTWGKLKNENIVIHDYYGDHFMNQITFGNELLIGTSDLNITYKTLLAFEFSLLNYQFDYLVRPNASTYVRLDKLYEYLQNKPRMNYYAGHVQTINNVTYAAGTYMIYSRDIVEYLVKNKQRINENQWADDWVIGKFLEQNNIKPTEHIAYYAMGDWWPETEVLEKMYKTPKEEFEKYIFFRCKTEINKSDPNQHRQDDIKMNYLQQILYS